MVALDRHRPAVERRLTTAPPGIEEEVYRALVCAIRDYVTKNGFEGLMGLTGGVDSGLVAAVAVDALGRERVAAVAMPSGYSSEESQTDAGAMAANSAFGCWSCRSPTGRRAPRRAQAPVFAGPSPASPRRTSRPGSGAPCS